MKGRPSSRKGTIMSEEQKKKISKTMKIRGSTKGENNGMFGIKRQGKEGANWKGYWVTPIGKFVTREEAAKEIKISIWSLLKFCKKLNQIPLKTISIGKSNCVFIKNAKVGQTPKELGFGFEPIE